jgi:hypothetical protein
MDLSRFEDLERLEPGALRILMVDVLSREPALSRVGVERLEGALDSLINDGFAGRMTDSTARRQALLLGAGVLLRLAGASVEAIRANLEPRDEIGLQGVLSALLVRLGGTGGVSHAEPAELVEDGEEAWEEHSPRTAAPVAMGSAPVIPRPPPSRPNHDGVSPPYAGGGSRANPAQRFLKGLIDDDVASLIRRADDVAGGRVRHERSPETVSARVEMAVTRGVRLSMSTDAVRDLAGPRQRAELVDAIRARLDALFG